MIIGVQISPDSEHVVAGASDGWIYIWKVSSCFRPPPMAEADKPLGTTGAMKPTARFRAGASLACLESVTVGGVVLLVAGGDDVRIWQWSQVRKQVDEETCVRVGGPTADLDVPPAATAAHSNVHAVAAVGSRLLLVDGPSICVADCTPSSLTQCAKMKAPADQYAVVGIRRAEQAITAGSDGLVRFWDVRASGSIKTYSPWTDREGATSAGPGCFVSALGVDAEENWLGIGGSGAAFVCNLNVPTVTSIGAMGTPSPVHALRLAHGTVLTGGAEPGLQAWDYDGKWKRAVGGSAQPPVAAVTTVAAADFCAYAGLGPTVEVVSRELDPLFALSIE